MKVRLLDWEKDVRIPMKYPKEDNNNGLIFGLEETDLEPPDYIEWFQTEKERDKCIKDNTFEVEQ